MRSKNLLFLLIVFGTISIIYSSRLGGTQYGLISNAVALIPPFLASLYGLNAARNYAPHNNHRNALILISAGLFFWFLGQLAFFLFRYVYEIYPYPSVADVSKLLGYPLILLGLKHELKANRTKLNDLNLYIKFLVTIIMSMLTVAVLYFGIYSAFRPGEPIMNNLVAIAYGLGDLVLIAPTFYVIKLSIDYRGGKLFMSWALILIALLLKLYTDVFFSSNRTQYIAQEWPFNMIDLVTVASYLLFAYSFYSSHSHLSDIRTKITNS